MPDGDRDPGGEMEQPIPERVRLQPGDRRRGVAALAGEHVMPLQDLVEHDPVDEPTEAEAEQDPRRAGPGERFAGVVICVPGCSTWVRAGRHAGREVTRLAVSETLNACASHVTSWKCGS